MAEGPGTMGGAPEVPDSDVERQALAFVQENVVLLEEGSAQVLGRIFVQGANISTVLSEEAVEAANRAERVTRDLAEAIRNPVTPAVRMHELETERVRAKAVHEHRRETFTAFAEFLDRVAELRQLRSREAGEAE